MDLVSQLHRCRSGIIYSKTGGKKTSQLARLARYYYDKYGITTRLISSDGGGWAPFEDSGLIEEGIVKTVNVCGTPNALAVMKRLSEGYWPRQQKNGETYFATDDKCKLPQEVLEKSCYMVEGLTSIAALWADHISNNAEDTGYKLSQQINEDGYRFGNLAEGHYGTMQKAMYNIFVNGFQKLPIKFLWTTALVDTKEDKQTATTYYGPRGAGTALTLEMPSWFGECWHLDDAMVKIKEGEKVVSKSIPVAWMRNHKEANTGVEYLAKVRILDSIIPQVQKKWPNGFVMLKWDKGLESFYDDYERMLREWKEQRKAQQKEG